MSGRRWAYTVADMIRENARSFPDLEALVCGSSRSTYRELDERVNRTCAVLADAGVGPGTTVVWAGRSCHRAIETILACAKAGAVAAPVNWRQSEDELAWSLETLDPGLVLLTDEPELGTVRNSVARLSAGTQVLTVDADYDQRIASATPKDPFDDEDEDLPLLEFFTAAFTGRPRGALLTHRNIVTQNLVLLAMDQVEGYGESYLASGPVFHIGVLLKLFATLHHGGRTVVLSHVEPDEVAATIEAERCTTAFLMTPTVARIVELNADGHFDLSSLRSTPGRPPAELADAWYAMTSCRPPDGAGVTGYGQTETTAMVTFEDRAPRGRGVFGRPSPLAIVRIVGEDRAEVPDGEVGEIAVRGPQLMLRYRDATADPNGWHYTNDLGRRELDGTVSFLGPKLDLIKTGMENVYPAEVENVLREHPLVAAACVIGVPDPVWGQSVRAVVQPAEGTPPGEDVLVEFVRSRIASYKKPKSVVFVDRLPMSGPVVDRAEVKRRFGA